MGVLNSQAKGVGKSDLVNRRLIIITVTADPFPGPVLALDSSMIDIGPWTRPIARSSARAPLRSASEGRTHSVFIYVRVFVVFVP